MSLADFWESLKSVPFGSAMATLLAFVCIGPLIGGGVVVAHVLWKTEFFMTAIPKDGSFLSLLSNSLFLLIFVVPVSYYLGFVPAGLAGLVVALEGIMRGRVSFMAALFGGFLGFGYSYMREITAYPDKANATSGLLLLAHIFSALACWLIVRPFWKTPR